MLDEDIGHLPSAVDICMDNETHPQTGGDQALRNLQYGAPLVESDRIDEALSNLS